MWSLCGFAGEIFICSLYRFLKSIDKLKGLCTQVLDLDYYVVVAGNIKECVVDLRVSLYPSSMLSVKEGHLLQ